MVMAAGLGTRLRPFTDQIPKPLVPVLGVPVSVFALHALGRAGVTEVVMNLHHLGDQIEQLLPRCLPSGMKLRFSDERDLLLGSAGGMRKAASHFGEEPFFLTNADTIAEVDYSALLRTHERLRAQWNVKVTLTIFPHGAGKGSYRELFFNPKTALLTGLGDLKASAPFFIGVSVVEPEAIRALPEGRPLDFVSEILIPALNEQKVGVYLANGLWYDIGSPELWLNTQLDLMNKLETGNLPKLWRELIEAESRRMASGIWVSKRSLKHARKVVPDWAGPAYWSQLNETDSAPKKLGPNVALYGPGPADGDSQGGVGYGAYWVPV